MKPHGKRTELLSKQRLLFFWRSEMKNIKSAAEEEFQKLPLKEREKLVSVVQTWNKAFECGVNYTKKTSGKESK